MSETKICQTCNEEFNRNPNINNKQWLTTKYCRRKCYTGIGSQNSRWHGGYFISNGYKYIYSPNHPFKTQEGYVCEHRLVMEQKLGRYLDKKEAIHHLNHNRNDNRIENLHLCPSSGKHFIEYHLISRHKNGRFKDVHRSLQS